MVGGLGRALADAGHDVVLVTPDRDPRDGQCLPAGVWQGLETRRLPWAGTASWPWMKGLGEAVADRDVVHLHGIDGNLFALARGRVPFVVQTHGLRFHRVRSPWWRRLVQGVVAPPLRRAAAVWATSRVDQALLGGVPSTVMAPGVDVDRTRRAGTGLAGLWVVPGRIDAHKGHADLIRSVARMDAPPKRVEVLGGDGGSGLVDGLARLCRRLGVADIFAFRGELERASFDRRVAEAEWAIFPSTFESFGLGVVEAQAAGVDVAVSPFGALPERVDHGAAGVVLDFAGRAAPAALTALRTDAARRQRADALVKASAWSVRVHDYVAGYAQALA